MTRSALSVAAAVAAMLAHNAAHAGPTTLGTVSATERPYTATQVDTMQKLATFGLCDAAQNADDLPTSPVPELEDRCSRYQQFEAVSATPSHGGSCGGYTVAFGPMGNLQTDWKRYTLRASYGEALTQAQCTKARLAAVAWGVRCLNDACTIASLQEGGQSVRKRARAFIRAEKGNGKCFSTSQPARQTPLQPAGQASGTWTPTQKRP